MNVSSISSGSATAALQTPAKPPVAETTEASVAGKDVRADGDTDDGSSVATAAKAAQSSINNLGQTIGKNLNVSA
jgi:hypothetical protein